MTAGSVRGKCWLPSTGQRRAQPAPATTVSAPQRGQCRCRACHCVSATAEVSRPASSSSKSAPRSRRPAHSSCAVAETAKYAVPSASPRKSRCADGSTAAAPVHANAEPEGAAGPSRLVVAPGSRTGTVPAGEMSSTLAEFQASASQASSSRRAAARSCRERDRVGIPRGPSAAALANAGSVTAVPSRCGAQSLPCPVTAVLSHCGAQSLPCSDTASLPPESAVSRLSGSAICAASPTTTLTIEAGARYCRAAAVTCVVFTPARRPG